jgi:hypothetical protein
MKASSSTTRLIFFHPSLCAYFPSASKGAASTSTRRSISGRERSKTTKVRT